MVVFLVPNFLATSAAREVVISGTSFDAITRPSAAPAPRRPDRNARSEGSSVSTLVMLRMPAYVIFQQKWLTT